MDFAKRHLRPLVGATVVAVDCQTVDMGGYKEAWPCIILRTPKGRILQVDVSRDPEGNGPGFCFINDTTEQQG